MFNKVILGGRLVQDPKVRKSIKGNDIVVLRIAASTPMGRDNVETLFINVICFGNLAEKCKTYLKKGSPLLVEGRLRYREWINGDGVKNSLFEVVASSVKFLPGGKRDSENEVIDENKNNTDEPYTHSEKLDDEELLLEPF